MLSLPHVTEAEQWGGLLFRVGEKTAGGKMFAMLNLEPDAAGVISFGAGAERFHEFCERDGLKPAPYLARAFWVAAERWTALRNSEWEEALRAAHGLTWAKLPKKVRVALG